MTSQEIVKTETEKLKGKSEGFRKGVQVAMKVGGQKKSLAAHYYMECRKRGADWAEGFEYGLLLAVRILQAQIGERS